MSFDNNIQLLRTVISRILLCFFILVLILKEIFRATKSEPPTIVSETDFIKDSLLITMDYVFEDADFYYTPDGSFPDSTALEYSKPIIPAL